MDTAIATAAAAASAGDSLRIGSYAKSSSSLLPHLPLDASLRLELMSNMIVSGGNTSFTGFKERLERSLGSLLPENAIRKVKLLSPSLRDRRVAAWLGGSVVGSLGSFHDLWMGRDAYEEAGGEALIASKCP